MGNTGHHMRSSVVACFIAASVITAAIAGPTGRVRGHVTDENGRALSGARIHVTGPGAVGHYETTTDPRGRYMVPGLPLLETLDIRAEFEGKAPIVYSGVMARDGSGTRRDFRLRPAGSRSYLIVLDARIPYHLTALEGVRAALPVSPIVVEMTGKARADGRNLRRHVAEHPNAIIAIGRDAARLARRWVRDVPVVYTLGLDARPDDLEATNFCSVPLNEGLKDQLRGLVSLRPEARRLATIYNPHTLSRAVKELRRAARELDMTLVARTARDPRQALAALDHLVLEHREGRSIDAFFLLLDPQVIDIAVFESIRRFAQERSLIFIVPDRSLVMAGGTFSFTPGFRELGAYAADVAQWIIARGARPSDLGATFPTTRYFTLNPVEARKLGLMKPAGAVDSPQTDEIKNLPSIRIETP